MTHVHSSNFQCNQEQILDHATPFHLRNQQLKNSNSCDELETIQEEDEQFQFSCIAEKRSKHGIKFNKRVISLNQDYLSYYSLVPFVQNEKILSKYKSKAKIFLKNISSVVILPDKPTCICVSGEGTVIHKEKLVKKNEKFNYLFRFANTQMPQQWCNIILAAKEAAASKSYIVTFEDLLQFSNYDTA